MKSIILRAIASMVVGLLLMIYPEKVTDWLVIVVGILFLIPGIYSIVSYWTIKNQEQVKVGLPIAGMGSSLLGIWMILDSSFFIKALMVAVAVILILVAVNRIIGNIQARKYQVKVPILFYVFPVCLMFVSFYFLSNPLEAAGLPFYILGISMMVYGFMELLNTLWLNNRIKKIAQTPKKSDDSEIEDAEIVG